MILLLAWIGDSLAGLGLYDTVASAQAAAEQITPGLEWEVDNVGVGKSQRFYTDWSTTSEWWEIQDVPIGRLSLSNDFGQSC